jgi:extracellular elastinolytic metalloproteinase
MAQGNSSVELVKSSIYAENPALRVQENTDWIVTDEVYSKHNGVTHLYLRQTYNSTEIFNANLSAAILGGKVINLAGTVVNLLEVTVSNSVTSIGAEEAILRSATHLGLRPGSSLQRTAPVGNTQTYLAEEVSVEPIPVKMVYWLSPNNQLVLSWDLNIYPPARDNWWSMRVDASTGEILEQSNWVTHCSFDAPHSHDGINGSDKHANHFRQDEQYWAGAQYGVYAMPVESPSHGAYSIASEPHNLTASPFGWHDTNGVAGAEYTITRGNNVYAYEDMAAINTPGYSPNGGTELNFAFEYVEDASTTPARDASITNLFYWNNIVHDVLYLYGFDEQSGNFQSNNYGKGGSGGDAVLAEDLDGSGTGNANFATPPDGQSPRMQMYLWWSYGEIQVTIESPGDIAGNFNAGSATFGPSLRGNQVSGELVLVTDESDNPYQGCGELVNTAELAGKIAVIDRGNCTFALKVKNAEDAGAIAVLILNNDSANPNAVLTMGADNPPTITIPSLLTTYAAGQIIKNALQTEAVFVSLSDSSYPVSSSFDNGIVVHEYGHGVSNRLTGGRTNVNCLNNAEQMGEGWSDYLGLVLTMKEGDTPEMSRGIGTFAAGQPTTGQGIRPAPYSTDMAVNSYTYAGVADNAISQPHGIGFIWSTMLWDMTWLFVDRYGFNPDLQNGNGGNQMALQLVMDGMKLQPCSPGFVNGRDAILLADRINNGGANQDIIWQAFAGRGLGYSASQGSSSNRFDGVQAFDMPPGCLAYPGSLQSNNGVSLPLSFCGDQIEELNFSVTFGTNNANKPGESHEYLFILTQLESPYTIEMTSTDGKFPTENLINGEYKLWGFSYLLDNEIQDVSEYISTGLEDVETILQEIASGNICASLTDKYTNNQIATITKTECVVAGTSLLEKSDFIRLYPNPTKGNLTLDIVNQAGKNADIYLYDLSGQLVIRESLVIGANDFRANLLLQNLGTGIYIINISIDGQSHVSRLLMD